MSPDSPPDETDDVPLEGDLGRHSAQEFYAGFAMAAGQILAEVRRQSTYGHNIESVIERVMAGDGIEWRHLVWAKGCDSPGVDNLPADDFDLQHLLFLDPNYEAPEVDLTDIGPVDTSEIIPTGEGPQDFSKLRPTGRPISGSRSSKKPTLPVEDIQPRPRPPSALEKGMQELAKYADRRYRRPSDASDIDMD